MTKLHLDFETRSEVDLKVVGTDVYTHHESTRVLMMAYAFDDGPVELWEPHLSPVPDTILAAINDPDVLKLAWNVYFEYSVFNSVLGIETPMSQWFDPIAHARYLGFPGKLEDCGEALGLPEELLKQVGTLLKNKFCKPTRATKKKPSYYHDWTDLPEQWEEFKEYCKHDVMAEREITRVLELRAPFSCDERAVWRLDQRINQRGIPIDLDFTAKALARVEEERALILGAMKELTGVENPNSGDQLKDWAKTQGFTFESLDKEHVTEYLKQNLPPEIHQLLELKKQLGGIAFKKLPVIMARTREGRIRDALTYHSAHTGRWASRGVQFHNLLRPTKRVKKNYEAIVEAIMGHLIMPADIPIIEAVSGTLRAAVKATEGSRLMIADYASIENRGLAWLAQCPAMLAVFKGFDKQGKPLDPYKSFGVKFYKKDYEDITDDERNLCKVPVLGCGYGMGWLKLIGYAAGMGITLEEADARALVKAWREAYPEVVFLWKAMGRAAVRAVKHGTYFQFGFLKFDGRDPNMFKIVLPNGRCLHYDKPSVGFDLYDNEVLKYHGWEAKIGGWVELEARGSSLVENVVQAMCRDILVAGLFRLEKKGFDVVLHVHDEVIADVPFSSPLTYVEFEHCLVENPEWSAGFPIAAEGFEAQHYKKG